MDSISLLLRANLESCLESYRRDKCGCSAASPHRSANAPGCQGRLLTGTVLQRLTDRHSHTGGGGGPSSRVAPTTDWQQFPGEGGGAARTCYRQGPPRLPLTSAAQRPAVLGYCCCCGALLRLAGGPVLAPRARPRSHRHGPAARADRRCTLQQGTRGGRGALSWPSLYISASRLMFRVGFLGFRVGVAGRGDGGLGGGGGGGGPWGRG